MYKLLKHQKEGIKYLLNHHYAILGDSMGLGKSLQAIEVIKRTKLKALIVCPSSLKLTWKAELEKFSDLEIDEDVKIISYAMLGKHPDIWKWADIVICDEVHYLKNLEAKRTQVVHNLMESDPPLRFIGLTGTAVKNRVTEYYSLLALCSYNPQGTSGINILNMYPNQWDFSNHFSNRISFKVKGRYVTKFEGHRNVEGLRSLLKDKYLRRKASQVLDLPPIVRKDILLDDKEIDKELLARLDQDAKAFATFKSNNALIKSKHTVRYCKDIIEQGEGPVLIFSDQVKPCQEISRLLNGPYKARSITGETPMKKREESKELFQAGKLDALVCTIGSMSTGHTLTKAKNLVFNDLSYVVGDIAQAEKRIHRIGQDKTCIIHRMFWGKMDAYLARLLDKKLATLREVL